MDLKLVGKNNIGTVVLLLLIIAVSQSKILDFLLHSALGRTFLIIFILYLSYCNKILGVVGVLFIIIMFNSNVYYEGYTTPNNKAKLKKTVGVAAAAAAEAEAEARLAAAEAPAQVPAQVAAAEAPAQVAAEGFDILGIENNIKRGKQSNSITLNNLSQNSDSVLPYDTSPFFENFSSF